MKKREIILISIAIILAYTISFGFLTPAPCIGCNTYTYPHDNLVIIIRIILRIIPIVFAIFCIIKACVSKKLENFVKKLILLMLIFVIVIPIGLKFVATSIEKYDRSHYEGTIVHQWKDASK